VRVVDSISGTVIADHSYTWCGTVRCLAHDNTQSGSPVSTQYFDEGIITNGAPFYYVTDWLGSVTQQVSNSGSIAAQYAYDPYATKPPSAAPSSPTSATRGILATRGAGWSLPYFVPMIPATHAGSIAIPSVKWVGLTCMPMSKTIR
jgi:hypothetical protein